MKNGNQMRGSALRGVVLGMIVASAVFAGTARADVTFTVNAGDPYQGYMNVFELPSNGGAFVFGSPWGTADLTASFSGGNLTLGPNSIGDPNPFWYIGGGAPGAPGNKIMEANMYVESAGVLQGQTITFTGTVLANTLTSAHVARAFIRDFAPDFSTVSDQFIVLPASGSFTISLALINDPARHVQYGFQVSGPDVWVTDRAQYGSVTIGPNQPTPAVRGTWGGLKALYR